MVYPEYLKIKSSFYAHQKRFEELLLSKEKIFADILPSGIRYDKDVVQTSPNDPMLKYVENLEDVEKKIAQTREALKDWEILLSIKERELRESKAMQDRVYVMRYLDSISVSRISSILCYSKRQIYRTIGKIEKLAQNGTNYVVK